MKTIHVATELPAPAEAVWETMQYPGTFLYVARGLVGAPALAGRATKFVVGEKGTGWLFLFHVVPLSRHTIEVVHIDHDTMTIETEEHGGMLRRWHHTLHVEPVGDEGARSRYSDTVDIDAGLFTGVVARFSLGIYRYRQRRWHRLARKHLAADGPAYARARS